MATEPIADVKMQIAAAWKKKPQRCLFTCRQTQTDISFIYILIRHTLVLHAHAVWKNTPLTLKAYVYRRAVKTSDFLAEMNVCNVELTIKKEINTHAHTVFGIFQHFALASRFIVDVGRGEILWNVRAAVSVVITDSHIGQTFFYSVTMDMNRSLILMLVWVWRRGTI